MDSDTMTRKDAYRKTLLAFRSGRIQILIGTQMIAKGLDFPNVTLVGIIYADLGLHIPDFRSGERTFQLLTQVAGRAGRGEQPGYVVVQTYTPFHPALECACDQDFKAFYEYEMPSREELGFPPFTHMALVHFRGENESAVAGFVPTSATTCTWATRSRRPWPRSGVSFATS
jgi:primosomal protein N' (replication factor Y)